MVVSAADPYCPIPIPRHGVGGEGDNGKILGLGRRLDLARGLPSVGYARAPHLVVPSIAIRDRRGHDRPPGKVSQVVTPFLIKASICARSRGKSTGLVW
jgi:hypothetical protein